MHLWLGYREKPTEDFDYELIDFTDQAEDYFPWDMSTEDQVVTQEIFDKIILKWLNHHGACLYGDRWYGVTDWDWYIPEKPPLQWYLDNMADARVRSEQYAKEAYDISVELLAAYPNVMNDMGG